MTSFDLFSDTQNMVRDCSLSTIEIAHRSEIGERWLFRYIAGDYQDVGVRRLQKLRDFLLQHERIAANRMVGNE